jgi:hypothetical protein
MILPIVTSLRILELNSWSFIRAKILVQLIRAKLLIIYLSVLFNLGQITIIAPQHFHNKSDQD